MSYYYDSNDNQFKRIPDAPFYVCSTDKFMSRWGHAKGKTNRVVVPCSDYETTQSVIRYIETRSEMIRTTLLTSRPRSRRNTIYSLCPKWIDRAKEMTA